MATKAEITAELERLGIEHDGRARKADLEELLEQSRPQAEPETTVAGQVDPRLVEERDRAREVEARTRVGRVRPTPAAIDPRLVEIREETRRADAESVKSATAPPPRG
jgi:hypothetical protein